MTFNIKNLGEDHDLFVQLDTLLLADIFESFRKTCQKEYHLDPVSFTTLPSFAGQVYLMKTRGKT